MSIPVKLGKSDMGREKTVALTTIIRDAYSRHRDKDKFVSVVRKALCSLYGRGWTVIFGYDLTVMVRFVKGSFATFACGGAKKERTLLIFRPMEDSVMVRGEVKLNYAAAIRGRAGTDVTDSDMPTDGDESAASGKDTEETGAAVGGDDTDKKPKASSLRSRIVKRDEPNPTDADGAQLPDVLEFVREATAKAVIKADKDREDPSVARDNTPVLRDVKDALTAKFGSSWQVFCGAASALHWRASAMPGTKVEATLGGKKMTIVVFQSKYDVSESVASLSGLFRNVYMTRAFWMCTAMMLLMVHFYIKVTYDVSCTTIGGAFGTEEIAMANLPPHCDDQAIRTANQHQDRSTWLLCGGILILFIVPGSRFVNLFKKRGRMRRAAG